MTDDDRRQARLDDLAAGDTGPRGDGDAGPRTGDGDTDAGGTRDEDSGDASGGAGADGTSDGTPGFAASPNEAEGPSTGVEGPSTGAESPPTGVEGPPGASAEVAETVELGVALLAHLEDGELTLAEAVDRIETVTTDPALTREILDTAELRGLVDREDGLVRPRSGAFVRFERDVVSREGEFDCRRCGASLSTGYFIRFDAGEHGPFGSSCVRKVTGRE